MGFMSNIFELTLDDVEFDIQVIGIAAHLKDYRIAYFINKELEIDLFKCPKDLEIEENKTGEKNKFSFFNCIDEEHEAFINLLSNKSNGAYVFKNKKEFDYFLIFSHQYPEKQRKNWIERLKNIKNVLVVKEVQPNEVDEPELFFAPQ